MGAGNRIPALQISTRDSVKILLSNHAFGAEFADTLVLYWRSSDRFG